MTTSDFFWVPYEMLLNLFQAFLYTWFMEQLLNKRKKERVSFLVCAALVFTAYSLYLFEDWLTLKIAFSDTWVKLLVIAYAFIFFRDHWWIKLLWSFMLLIIPSSVISFAYYGNALLLNADYETFLLRGFSRLVLTVSGNLLLGAVLILIVYLFRPLKKRNYATLQSVLFILIIDLSGFLIQELMFRLYPEGSVSNLLFVSISGLSLAICLASLFLYRSFCGYAEKETELYYLRGQKDAIDNRLGEISSIYSMMLLMQHDIRKHMQVTEDLLSRCQIEESQAYLSDISAHLENLFTTGCLPLDSSLTIRQKILKEHKIAFQYELCDLQKLPLPTADFCAIVMNLLDNAIEASIRHFDDVFEHFVKLSIRHHRDMLFIECTNPCPSVPLKKQNGRFVSTKHEPGHGYGLVMVEKITESAQGDCSFTQQGEYFKAYVALPYTEKKAAESGSNF